MSTIFERGGGFAALHGVVSDFYDRVLDTPCLPRHFAGVDMRRMVDHQTKFVAQVTGGPSSFTREQLMRAHARLSVTHAEFRQMAALLGEALEDRGVAAADVAETVSRMAAYEDCIVGGRADRELH